MKQLTLSVESQLPKLSSEENIFIQAAPVCQKALERARYNRNLSYKCNSNNHNNNDK